MSQTRPQPGVFRVNWAADDQEILQARLRYPFSDVSNSPTLVIPCRKFVPDRKDILTEAWKGDENTQGGIGFPPYACVRGTASIWEATRAEHIAVRPAPGRNQTQLIPRGMQNATEGAGLSCV